MSNPSVSIVMPAYNAQEYITTAVESILEQSVTTFELIIVDDCSTDGTWGILSGLAQRDSRITIKQLARNSGSAKYPREVAVSMSSAPFICWIDADDIVEKRYLERLINRQEECDADIVCSQMIAFEERPSNILYKLPAPDFDYSQITKGVEAVMYTIGVKWRVNINGWLVRKSMWSATSTYLNTDILHMDVDNFSSREMLLAAHRVAFVEAKYHYRVHNCAITKSISYKLFESLITDEMTITLFKRIFGDWSKQTMEAYGVYAQSIINLSRIYVINQELLDRGGREARNILKSGFGGCKGYRLLRVDIDTKYKLLLSLPFPIFIRCMKFINR